MDFAVVDRVLNFLASFVCSGVIDVLSRVNELISSML